MEGPNPNPARCSISFSGTAPEALHSTPYTRAAQQQRDQLLQRLNRHAQELQSQKLTCTNPGLVRLVRHAAGNPFQQRTLTGIGSSRSQAPLPGRIAVERLDPNYKEETLRRAFQPAVDKLGIQANYHSTSRPLQLRRPGNQGTLQVNQQRVEFTGEGEKLLLLMHSLAHLPFMSVIDVQASLSSNQARYAQQPVYVKHQLDVWAGDKEKTRRKDLTLACNISLTGDLYNPANRGDRAAATAAFLDVFLNTYWQEQQLVEKTVLQLTPDTDLSPSQQHGLYLKTPALHCLEPIRITAPPTGGAAGNRINLLLESELQPDELRKAGTITMRMADLPGQPGTGGELVLHTEPPADLSYAVVLRPASSMAAWGPTDARQQLIAKLAAASKTAADSIKGSLSAVRQNDADVKAAGARAAAEAQQRGLSPSEAEKAKAEAEAAADQYRVQLLQGSTQVYDTRGVAISSYSTEQLLRKHPQLLVVPADSLQAQLMLLCSPLGGWPDGIISMEPHTSSALAGGPAISRAGPSLVGLTQQYSQAAAAVMDEPELLRRSSSSAKEVWRRFAPDPKAPKLYKQSSKAAFLKCLRTTVTTEPQQETARTLQQELADAFGSDDEDDIGAAFEAVRQDEVSHASSSARPSSVRNEAGAAGNGGNSATGGSGGAAAADNNPAGGRANSGSAAAGGNSNGGAAAGGNSNGGAAAGGNNNGGAAAGRQSAGGAAASGRKNGGSAGGAAADGDNGGAAAAHTNAGSTSNSDESEAARLAAKKHRAQQRSQQVNRQGELPGKRPDEMQVEAGAVV